MHNHEFSYFTDNIFYIFINICNRWHKQKLSYNTVIITKLWFINSCVLLREQRLQCAGGERQKDEGANQEQDDDQQDQAPRHPQQRRSLG